MIDRRTFIASVSAVCAASVMPAQAQSNLVRLVVPLTPGTTPDTIARVMSPVLQKQLGAAIVVENKPGASGMIGMKSVAQSTDVGMLMVVPATTVTLPHFYTKMDFDVLKSFAPITRVASSSFVLVVGNNVKVGNLSEFTDWVKSHPGSFYASPGNGTHHHLFMEMLLQSLGVKLEHVPYKGSGPALNDVMAGLVPTMFLPIQVAVPLRDAGRLKIIGGSLRDRHPGFPEIPSLQELGAKNYHADPWFAVWGSPKIPDELAEKYRAAFEFAMDDPGVKGNLTKQGLILKSSSPAELLRLSKEESDMWTRVIQTAKIKPEE